MLPEGGIGVGVGVGEAVVLVESGQPGIVDSNCTYTQACDHCPERTYTRMLQHRDAGGESRLTVVERVVERVEAV